VHGWRKAEQISVDNFELRSQELVQTIETTWRAYETATLSFHNICRRSRNTTRQEFRDFYLYLLASGLEFESVQCSPNVTHAERDAYEREARDFYKEHYPTIDYQGIIGFIPDPDDPEGLIVVPSPPLDFYFPVHYLEPVLPNAPAIELDMYSYPSQKNEIDLAVTTRQPVLSKRLNVVQETEEFAYSVIIYHPGILLEDEPDDFPTELSLILVRMPSLLKRVSQSQEENLAVYVYDTSVLNTGGAAEFLGAGAFTVQQTPNGTVHYLELIDEVDYETFYNQNGGSSFYWEEEVLITPSGSWLVVVVPVDDTYKPNMAYVLLAGFLILAAGFFIAAWYYSNAQRHVRMSAIRLAAEAERAQLIVKNAEKSAQTERELNDFLGESL